MLSMSQIWLGDASLKKKSSIEIKNEISNCVIDWKILCQNTSTFKNLRYIIFFLHCSTLTNLDNYTKTIKITAHINSVLSL